jgi:hypothetical protein
MHAYLITGTDKQSLDKAVKKLTSELKLKIMEFPLNKIEDVRVLGSFVNLSLDRHTAIVVHDIDAATIPAQNAFLKNLEEPQENLTYILTARSQYGVLSTIVSRCQLVGTGEGSKIDYTQALEFIRMSPGEKLAKVDKIHSREDALEFTQDFVLGCHELLHKTKEKHSLLAKYLKVGTKTFNSLKQNGNVVLQLTDMVVNLN